MEQSRYVTIFGSSRFNTTVARRPKPFGATDAKLAALERSQDRVVAQAIWGLGQASAFMKMAYAVACVVVPTLMVMGATFVESCGAVSMSRWRPSGTSRGQRSWHNADV